jgi:hypothetical protein
VEGNALVAVPGDDDDVAGRLGHVRDAPGFRPRGSRRPGHVSCDPGVLERARGALQLQRLRVSRGGAPRARTHT